MFRGPEKLSPLRKWNLVMLFGIVSLLFAQQITGHVIEIGKWIDYTMTAFGVGLFVGVLLQLRKGRE